MRISDWSSDVCSSDLRDAHLEEGVPLGHLLINFQERPGIRPLLALHHRARTRGDAGSGRAGRDDQLGCVQLLIGCPHGAPSDAELGGEVLPGGQTGAGFEHAAFDRGRHAVSDLLGERRPGRAVRSEETTYELQSLMSTSYAVFCLKKKNKIHSM